MGNQKSKILEQSILKHVKTEDEVLSKNSAQNILLDPRSPDANRTPLTKKCHQLNYEQMQVTPRSNSKEMKFLDPRSPSQFIPRTPLHMSMDNDRSNHETDSPLEYSGCIEEASCRNFNERLANITFDDYVEAENEHIKTMEVSCGEKIDSMISPIVLPPELSKNGDDEIIMHYNKRNAKSTLSSTPISLSMDRPKSLLIKKYLKKSKNTEIFMDEDQPTTPTMKFNGKPRTPFGSLLNHHDKPSKSVDNLQQQFKDLDQQIDKPLQKIYPRATSKSNFCIMFNFDECITSS